MKDEGAVLRGVMFKGYASKLAFLPENGMKVILTGRVSAYVKDGSYQIYAFTMEPDGVGSLYLAFEQLKKKLEQKGYFSPQYKKPLPKYPTWPPAAIPCVSWCCFPVWCKGRARPLSFARASASSTSAIPWT